MRPILLEDFHPWWETTTGMVVVLGAIVGGIGTIIGKLFTMLSELKKISTKVEECKDTTIKNEARIEMINTDRVTSKLVTNQHLLSLQDKIVELNRALPPNQNTTESSSTTVQDSHNATQDTKNSEQQNKNDAQEARNTVQQIKNQSNKQ
jgi:hypothetical protein